MNGVNGGKWEKILRGKKKGKSLYLLQLLLPHWILGDVCSLQTLHSGFVFKNKSIKKK